MADFITAFVASSVAGAGYTAVLPDIEIYCGIDRHFHPTWGGWPIIDSLKFAASDESELNSSLEQNKKLKEKVRELFKQVYWDRFCGDQVPDQEIATELFQSALELGVARAVNGLQKSLNALNPGSAAYAHVVEDGRLGPMTLGALQSYLETEDPSSLLKAMRILQALHYIARIKKNPGRDPYARAWLRKLVVAREKRKPAPPTDLRIED
jgi:lysozyme family protein